MPRRLVRCADSGLADIDPQQFSEEKEEQKNERKAR